MSRTVEVAPGATLLASLGVLGLTDAFLGPPEAHFLLIQRVLDPIFFLCKLF